MDIKETIESAGAAVRTLKTLGYTYHGAEYWKPPIGNPHLEAQAPAMYEALLAMSKGEGSQPGTTIESILIKARGEIT